eukprot:6205523-Pleurochrysis_carterae.AAC.2
MIASLVSAALPYTLMGYIAKHVDRKRQYSCCNRTYGYGWYPESQIKQLHAYTAVAIRTHSGDRARADCASALGMHQE